MSIFKRASRWSDESYLRGLPEMEMFPSDEAREAAIRDINRGFYTWKIVPVLLLHCILLLVVLYGLAQTISRAWPAIAGWSGTVSMVVTLLAYAVYVSTALRRGLVHDLRRHLIEAGVAVCLKCGYDLRGQPADSRRCPECGARLA